MLEREILLTSTNVQAHSYIHDDIVFSILSKLPLKSFKRFQSVSKSWSLLFDDPYFMNMYRKSFLAKDSSYYDDKSLLIHSVGEDTHLHLYSLSGKRFENRAKLELLKPSLEDLPLFHQNHFEILGSASINGILCLRIYNIYNGCVTVILWNPTTKEFKKVPSSQSESLSLGRYDDDHLVGYDRLKDDYKVIKITYTNSWKVYKEIYSLSSNSWKELDVYIPTSCARIHKVYLYEMCHWWNSDSKQIYVVSFDFSHQSFIKTFMPSNIEDSLTDYFNCSVLRKLVILNGSIAFISSYSETSTFHISILGEIGVKESWSKLFVVSPSPYLKCCIGAGNNGKLLFIRKDNEIVWFDLSTGMMEEIGVKALSKHCNILFHRESIIPIRGI